MNLPGGASREMKISKEVGNHPRSWQDDAKFSGSWSFVAG